jgi:hypothetical protein
MMGKHLALAAICASAFAGVSAVSASDVNPMSWPQNQWGGALLRMEPTGFRKHHRREVRIERITTQIVMRTSGEVAVVPDAPVRAKMIRVGESSGEADRIVSPRDGAGRCMSAMVITWTDEGAKSRCLDGHGTSRVRTLNSGY